jgi:hypothetical protein
MTNITLSQFREMLASPADFQTLSTHFLLRPIILIKQIPRLDWSHRYEYTIDMLQAKPIETGIVEIKSTVRINHPQANLMTIHIGHDAHCDFPHTVELALSNGYWFLTDTVPEFAPWAVEYDDNDRFSYYNMRSADHDGILTAYFHVPLATLAKFLAIYKV